MDIKMVHMLNQGPCHNHPRSDMYTDVMLRTMVLSVSTACQGLDQNCARLATTGLTTHLSRKVLGCIAAVIDVHNAPGTPQPIAVLAPVPGHTTS
jgi:hypothetical protein